MSQLTDDAVGQTVRSCLTAHEGVVDADRARAISTRVVAAAEAAEEGAVPGSRSVGGSRLRRRPRRPVVLAGLAAAAALVVAVVGTQLGGHDAPTKPIVAAGLPLGDARNKALTEAEVARALTLVPSLPGARGLAAAEAGAVRGDAGRGVGNGVSDMAYATAPGSVASAVAYLRAHPPTGYAASRPERLDAGVQSVTFYPTTADKGASDAWGGLLLSATVASGRDGVLVRRTAGAVWRPVRIEATRLPPDARLVSVTRHAGSPPSETITVDRALGSRFLVRMAALRAAVPFLSLCPGLGLPVDTFTLSGTGGPFVVTARLGCAGGVTVSRAGVDAGQTLDDAASLDALVRNLPGTPTG